MTETELSAWLALYFTPKIGPKRFAKLLSKDDPCHLIQAPSVTLRALGLSDPQIRAFQGGVQASVEACLTWQLAPSRQILSLTHPHYPPLLKQISDPPPLLFVEGDTSLLSAPQIAMVGSRHASSDGLDNARRFAKALVSEQMVITSGLALGIDGYAHDGALNAGGKTIAVLGSGLERIYPKRHQGLAQRIIEQGALVSEFAPSMSPRAEYFPRRNRVISGLSLGVLVVEAAKNSGSLITARLAAEQGREVFAIPSSLGMPNGQGGNHLIQQGAALVMSAQDILDEVKSLLDWSTTQQSTLFSSANEQQQLPFPELLANVGTEATPVDILASRTNIPVQEVMMQLLELELSGHVVAVSGGYIRKGRSEL